MLFKSRVAILLLPLYFASFSGCAPKQGERPPPALLTELYGDQFEYVEYDSLYLNALPLTEIRLRRFVDSDTYFDMGINGIFHVLSIEPGRKWLFYDKGNFPHFLVRTSDGYRAEQIGKIGNGPGEFQQNRPLDYWLDDGHIWMATGNYRLMKFSLDGELIDQWPTTSNAGVHITGALVVADRGYADSTFAVVRPMSSILELRDDPGTPCLPKMPPLGQSGLPFETGQLLLASSGQGLVYWSRLPFLVLFSVDDTGKCPVARVTGLDPRFHEGTELDIQTHEYGRTMRYRSLLESPFFDGACWLTNSSLVDGMLRVCDGEPVARYRFTTPEGEQVRVYHNGWNAEAALFVRSFTTQDFDVYQADLP